MRARTAGLPRIKEIRFHAPGDPVKELLAGEMDMALDLTAEEAGKLQGKDGITVPTPDADKPNRRICFLAVNHTRHVLRNSSIRLALARVIDRDGLLNEYFRKGFDGKIHRVISGPFPAGSWACNPLVTGQRKAEKNDLDDQGRSGRRVYRGETC